MQPQREVALLILQYAPAGASPRNIGVLLLDCPENSLYIQVREEWAGFPEHDLDILSYLAEDLQLKARDLGAIQLVAYLEDTLSNTFRVTPREVIRTDDINATLTHAFTIRCT